jgi:signal peptidase II
VAGFVEQMAFVLVVGGAVGNVIDRLARGYVVDFIHIQRWPVFNVADAAICAGGALVGIVMMRARTETSFSLSKLGSPTSKR